MFDGIVESPSTRHSGESRSPEPSEMTGFSDKSENDGKVQFPTFYEFIKFGKLSIRSRIFMGQTTVNLFGSLRKKAGCLDASPILIDIENPMHVIDVLGLLDIDSDWVQLAMVNFKAVSKETTLRPGDRLSLFPREHPIFADWKDLRV